MIHDTTIKAFGRFIDEVTARPGTVSKQAEYRRGLARRLKNIAGDLSLEGRDADANVLYEVIDALGGAQ
jgi:hypothetical protein